MHARRTARDTYFPSREDDAFFAVRGDIGFSDMGEARRFADRVNQHDQRGPDTDPPAIRPAELAAMALLHEIFHAVIALYRKRAPDAFERLRASTRAEASDALLAFVATFPPPVVYKYFAGEGDESPAAHLARGGDAAENDYAEETILLFVTNQNPAYEPVRVVVSDHDMGPTYHRFVEGSRRFFANEAPFGPRGENLVDLLLAPARAHPDSIFAQLGYVEENWGRALGLDELPLWRRILWAKDFQREEGRWFLRGGPGPGAPNLDAMRFGPPDEEAKRFSDDLDWMPRVVLVAKTVYVWLDQLSKKYQRAITRLDEIPDEELELLASRGFTGLWLIGLFERSRASRKIKQLRGDQDAVASAYSLKAYAIAGELGGQAAYENLRARAWARGLRLAADMVPNHVGIDADWVVEHPDWFLSAPRPPFPSYRFGGPDLSDDPRASVFIEEGYWNSSDAAVVFRRHDRWTGDDRFIYHGNDGTSMPWNDTAQLDYTQTEVRQAVIETILHVARMFPIIRFDAAMTLAKRHFKRLWFPFPGAGDGIPSRSDYSMSQEEFDRLFPTEFWREVVDTVAARAPGTLLLAEAFWMMEGYFVRTLGMHRVYNSAFMNMLKREENDKYRQTIKNVLEFDPEILKRFVNFMNNPDEETAVAQFGHDDKYFGVCVLMATMPGLPMFGHGQVEGYHEKYGMEYRRPKWDEHENRDLVARHEREIFPLLRRRYLFSGVSDFAFYDFVAEGDGVDEDVFAYSNRAGSEHALVLYNNKWKTTRGRIHGSLYRGTLAKELGFDSTVGEWLVFRDAAKSLEYIRPSRELEEGGLFWQLDAFKYHVFVDFRTVTASATKPYDRLAAELSGRGVPSIEDALAELHFQPIHAPLREACSKGHLEYLAAGWDPETKAPSPAAIVALEERLGHIADGLEWMIRKGTIAPASPPASPTTRREEKAAAEPKTTDDDASPRSAMLKRARQRYTAVLELGALESAERELRRRLLVDSATSASQSAGRQSKPAPPADVRTAGAGASAERGSPGAATIDARATGTSTSATPRGSAPVGGRATDAGANHDRPWLDVELLLAWIEVEGVLDLLAFVDPKSSRAELAATWRLERPLASAFVDKHGEEAGRRRAELVLLGATLPSGELRAIVGGALDDPRSRAFMNVHEADGVTWLVKERFEELADLLAEREALSKGTDLGGLRTDAKSLSATAKEKGYRVDAIRSALAKQPAPRAPSR